MQVSISFPGADFDKGYEGHAAADIYDNDGEVLASNGTEMAEALRNWLRDDWLGSKEEMGEVHPQMFILL